VFPTTAISSVLPSSLMAPCGATGALVGETKAPALYKDSPQYGTAPRSGSPEVLGAWLVNDFALP
jgi:hypothetical protein